MEILNQKDDDLYLKSLKKIDLKKAKELVLKFNISIDHYIYISYRKNIFQIKRTEEGFSLDLLNKDYEFIEELGLDVI